MFRAGNSYEVVHFGRDNLEKQRGGPHQSLYSRRNTGLLLYYIYNIASSTYLCGGDYKKATMALIKYHIIDWTHLKHGDDNINSHSFTR